MFDQLTDTERVTLSVMMDDASTRLYAEADALLHRPPTITAAYTGIDGADPYLMWTRAGTDCAAIWNELNDPAYVSPVWGDLDLAGYTPRHAK